MKVSNEVRELLAARRRGHSLDAQFYTSQEIFDLDMEAIFGRHWIYVGVEPDIPEAGDYFTVKLGRASVVVLRNDDMELRAFHNVCRHRGAQLCNAHKGSVGNLVCPYHQWTYDLSGKLIYAEHMGEDFDPSGRGLKRVHVESVAGLIFVCLAENPPEDFARMRETMSRYIAPHQLTDCKIAVQDEIVEAGNWKLVMENNRECYHCVSNHPELTISLYEYGFGYQPSPSNIEQVQAFRDLTEPANLTAVWRATNQQDRELVEMSQRGIADPAYEPGPYSPYTEELVEKFANWYVGRLEATVE